MEIWTHELNTGVSTKYIMRVYFTAERKPLKVKNE